jgi:mercuric ion binding protein
MKRSITTFACAAILALTISCKQSTEKTKTVQLAQKQRLKKIALQIEGMTCQIGCAKTIESRLSKTPGIESAAVSFEKRLGEIIFDTNQISESEISEKISSIGDGNTYLVVAINNLKL